MFKRHTLVLILMLSFVMLLAGCGSDSASSKGYGDVLRDKNAIKKVVADMKSKGGSPLKLFQNVNFGAEHITFYRQDPKNLENVDEFTWFPETGWQGPKATKLSGSGRLEDNLYDIDDVNWEAIPDFIAEVEKKAAENNMEKPTIDGILIYFAGKNKLSFSAIVKSERKDASASGDIKTGKVTYFKIR